MSDPSSPLAASASYLPSAYLVDPPRGVHELRRQRGCCGVSRGTDGLPHLQDVHVDGRAERGLRSVRRRRARRRLPLMAGGEVEASGTLQGDSTVSQCGSSSVLVVSAPRIYRYLYLCLRCVGAPLPLFVFNAGEGSGEQYQQGYTAPVLSKQGDGELRRQRGFGRRFGRACNSPAN